MAGSLEETGDRLFTFPRLDPSQWKPARRTDAIERMNNAFRRAGLRARQKESLQKQAAAHMYPGLTFLLFEMLLPLTRFRLIDLGRLQPGCRDPAGSIIKETTDMANGTVKWFNTTKGFGFIQPEQGSRDVFLHISAVERAGINRLDDGQAVTFDIETGRDGRESANNLALA